MDIFHSEGAGVGPGDQPTDVGVEVLQCHSWVFDAFWTDLWSSSARLTKILDKTKLSPKNS